jgi:hypothetical protein
LTVLAGAALFLWLAYRYESRLARLTTEFEKSEEPYVPLEQCEQWKKAVEDGKKRSSWEGLKQEVDRASHRAREGGDEKRVTALRAFRRDLRRWDLSGFAMGALLSLAAGFFQATLIFFACFFLGILVLIFFQRSPVERQMGAYLTVLIAGIIATILLYPSPLPVAEVIRESGEPVSGKFVLITEATWYLGTDDGTLEAIPSDQIACARITPQPRPGRFWSEVWQFEGAHPQPAPPLKCTTAADAKRRGRSTGNRGTTSGGSDGGRDRRPAARN